MTVIIPIVVEDVARPIVAALSLALALGNLEHFASAALPCSPMHSFSTTQPTVSQPAAPPPPSTRPPDTGSRAQYMNGFGGVPQPVQGNVSTQCQRLALSSPPAIRSLLHSSTITPHERLSRQVTATLHPPLQSILAESKVIVVCWPMVPPGSLFEPAGYPAPKISVHNDHTKCYAERFKEFHLVFTIKVPTQGHISPVEFSSQIKANLDPHDISLPLALRVSTLAPPTTYIPSPLLSSRRRSTALTTDCTPALV
ncbi:hypothetical protein MVEN_00113200 [Mycena venus]|uniref:Uncharacterized protein n=1 Tax=Mycena venus TaxID=2733690 RepID=A0A8H6Z4P1_9AGAR|nr:hypothetical protein MVEN_00113200 [Mycena venus]